jgi:asparagine synthase (glutamine-hydrolysing)
MLYAPGDEIDSTGIISCLLLGVPVPPLTPFKHIHSLKPGFKYSIKIETLAITYQNNCLWTETSDDATILSVDRQVEILSNAINKKLYNICPSKDPVILFSGGVDSAVLAMQAASLDWKNTSLFHFSFGRDDKETQYASEMASIFGLNLKIAYWDKHSGYECLQNAASLYDQIFCDISTIPSYSLCKEVVRSYGTERVIIDGLGADGVFGRSIKSTKYSNLYRYPIILRQFIASFYKTLNLWNKINVLEHQLRIIRRSAVLQKIVGFKALNPLINIAYIASEDDIQKISSLYENWIFTISGTDNAKIVLPMVNNGFLSASNQVHKNLSLFKHSACKVTFPFLDHDIVDLGLFQARFWPGNQIEKRSLKYMLAKSVRSEIVYRKKQGFSAPLTEQFSHPVYLAHLYELKKPKAPLHDFVDQHFLNDIIVHLISKREMPIQTYNFLWSVTFANSWLSKIKEASQQLKDRYLPG